MLFKACFVLVLLPNLVHPKCSPPEAIEKKLEAKMEQAAKEGKEYKPIEDPVTAFMKLYPKVMRDSLPKSLAALKDVKKFSKLASTCEELSENADQLATSATALSNVTKLMNDHAKFISSSLLKFHRLETIPAKFFRPLRLTAKYAITSVEEVVKGGELDENAKPILETAARNVREYKDVLGHLDERKTEMFLRDALEELRKQLDLEDIMGRLPHKSDLYKNFQGGQMTILLSQLSAAPVEALKRFVLELDVKMSAVMDKVKEKRNYKWTAGTMEAVTKKLAGMTNNDANLEFLKTSIKALVMAIKRTSEFPTDEDLIAALTDKLFLGEQAAALEKSSNIASELAATVEALNEQVEGTLNKLREKIDENRQNAEGWYEFKTVADAVKAQRVEMTLDDADKKLDDDVDENIDMLRDRAPHFAESKDEL
jgi:ABC-type transporter Mla subunit MlaD